MKIRKLLPRFKHRIIKLRNYFYPDESILSSKKKWDDLAREDAEYYIWSEKKNPTPGEFKNSGKADYQKYILDDGLLQKKLREINAKSILEIGCGVGRMTEFFADDFDIVYGVDISGEMIKKARLRLFSPKLKFLEGDGVRLPLGSETVDFIFSFIVFQHMPSVEVVAGNFKEAQRVLKNSGIFKVQLRGNVVDKKGWFYGASFNKKNAAELARQAGFKVINTYAETERYLWLTLQK